MCIAGKTDAPRRRRAGFTLLEVMTATFVIALLMMVLYRFISTTLTAINAMTEITSQRQEIEAVTKLIQTQLNDLPVKGSNLLLGKAYKFRDLQSDEMTWLCRAGQGVLTGAAPGEYRVTLALQPSENDKAVTELGLRRELVSSEEKSDADFFSKGSGTTRYNWLPLIASVAAMEIRYWDPGLKTELQQWTNPAQRPSFVHVKIWKTADDVPYDAILPVPSANIR
ncbi:MAG TPA: prepilin-type N-terminal cleavage/methylation domain-containing protein [Chthoniobacteraceae bacterium]|jgi:prepilin-type N-terminal cleavage/methylation domain-containing protein|nr:hypothetical protein [Chthoniobacter sp.]HEV7869222.1 prepilin-type N-terminal cleavage/methylation domain-containing protein [Chthoniobacteraceae bacterium]